MLLPSDFHRELHDWILVMFPTSTLAWPVLAGTVRNDTKGRFADGRLIQTSLLLTPVETIRAGMIVQTLNTRYLLGRAGQRH